MISRDLKKYGRPCQGRGASPEISFLTPDEIGETARMIEAATNSKKHPYLLKSWDAATETDNRLKEIDPLPEGVMFKYRTRARRYMVMAEIG